MADDNAVEYRFDSPAEAKKASTWLIKYLSFSVIFVSQSCMSFDRSISSAVQKLASADLLETTRKG